MKVIIRIQKSPGRRVTLPAVLSLWLIAGVAYSQLQQSGGGGSNASVSATGATQPSSGTFVSGSVTTAAPTYTTGTSNALSMDTSGNLRVLATQSGTYSASQSGTWTVQPGNTANTTPWFTKQIPLNVCSGFTIQDIQQVDVATSAGSNLTTADTCVFTIIVNNKSNNAAAVRIQDRAGTPVIYVGGNNDFSVPANSNIVLSFMGKRFTSGVTVIAGTASTLNAFLIGVQ